MGKIGRGGARCSQPTIWTNCYSSQIFMQVVDWGSKPRHANQIASHRDETLSAIHDAEGFK